MKARILPLALVITFGLVVAAPVQAYDWPTCSGNKRVWNDGDNITYRPFSVSFPSGSGSRAALEAARSAWNSAPNTEFNFNFSYLSSGSSGWTNDRNEILYTSDYSWGNCVLAVERTDYKSCIWPFWGGKIKESDIYFRTNPVCGTTSLSWNTSTTPNDPTSLDTNISLALVAVHEMGHSLGLSHEDDVVATMNSVYPNSGVVSNNNLVQPHADDVLGNRAGYGTTGSTRDLIASFYRRTTAGNSGFITPPGTVNRNTPTSVQFTIANRGKINETSVGVKFYLSTDRTITSADHLVGSAGFSINAGTTYTGSVSLNIPFGTIPSGNYHFGWIVDPENYIAEGSFENNNVASLPATLFLSNLQPPNACFTLNTTFGEAPLWVNANASCSSDDGTITSYTWTWGDGTTGSGSSVWHTYNNAGYYTVTLTVRDNNNLTDSTTKFVQVTAPCGPLGISGEAGSDKLKEPCLIPFE